MRPHRAPAAPPVLVLTTLAVLATGVLLAPPAGATLVPRTVLAEELGFST